MVKKEKQVINAVEQTKLEVTPTEEVTSVEPTTKKTTRKTKSETPKKTTKTTKASKAAKEDVTIKEVIKEVPVEVIKEVPVEVVKIVTPQVFFQFAGTEVAISTLVEQAQAAWVAAGKDAMQLSL